MFQLAQTTQSVNNIPSEFWLAIFPSISVIVSGALSAFLAYYFGVRREVKMRDRQKRLESVTRLRGLRFKVVHSWTLSTLCKGELLAMKRKDKIDGGDSTRGGLQVLEQGVKIRGVLNEQLAELYEQIEVLRVLLPKLEGLQERIGKATLGISNFESWKYNLVPLHEVNDIKSVDEWEKQLDSEIRKHIERFVGRPIDELIEFVANHLKGTR